ncbi:MAG: hypothetical protein L6408_06395, partial [Nanoarchaeota archaeon]|nr:hypothetical protein [Nanoarchaeota archaeon]
MKLPQSFSGDKDRNKHLEKILDPSEAKVENRLVYIEMVDSELYKTINEAYKEFKAATGSPKAI